MVEVINNTRLVKARKDYRDGCAEFIMDVLSELRRNEFGKLSFKEWRSIAESIRDNWKIKKGDLHEVQVCKYDGEIYSFRSKPGLAKICHKFDLFPEL
jgi:hypothetical protein